MEVFWFVLVLVIVLLIIIAVSASKKQSEAAAGLEYRMKQSGFTASKRMPVGGMELLIDDVNKKWMVKRSRIDDNPPVYNYSDLISFEVYEDGNSIAKGKRGSAIVGGMLFGVVGAVVGAAGSKGIKNTCSSLQVRIRINNLQTPEIVIPFITSETKKDSFVYKTLFESAKSMASTLEYMQNGKEVDFAKPASDQIINANSGAEELEKYYQLKEKGIISEDEFNEKKAQLLK